MDSQDPKRLVEAIVFASATPVPLRELVDRLPDDVNVESILAELSSDYGARGVVLEEVAGCWTFRTAPDLAPYLDLEREEPKKLSRAAIETLAIIAYHQPVTRAEIEDIRGTAPSQGTFDILMKAGWIKTRGVRRTPGLPMTWGTTDGFLQHFGLSGLDDLPGLEELKRTGLLDSSPRLSGMRDSSEDDDDLGPDTEEADDAEADLFDYAGKGNCDQEPGGTTDPALSDDAASRDPSS